MFSGGDCVVSGEICVVEMSEGDSDILLLIVLDILEDELETTCSLLS